MSTILEEYVKNTMATTQILPAYVDVVLNNLKAAEGGMLHHNAGEEDITNGYGIYRKVYPGAEIFKYLDLVAKSLTILTPSSKWTKIEIAKINTKIDKNVERYLSAVFYVEYFKGAHLELFHNDNIVLMANLYTNSTKGAWMSIQEGLIDMQKFGYLKVSEKELSGVDGSFGNMTAKNLALLQTAGNEIQLIFKLSIINGMKSYYIDLASKNPTKFLTYLNGWDNRMETLQHQ